jgi:ABC-type dipeptide/oligopeptide/nickel transport system ATPase component
VAVSSDATAAAQHEVHAAFSLVDINLRVARGSLTAVVGSVGAGKSSIAMAVLGEMHRVSGTAHCRGPIGYVAQSSWIQARPVAGRMAGAISHQKQHVFSHFMHFPLHSTNLFRPRSIDTFQIISRICEHTVSTSKYFTSRPFVSSAHRGDRAERDRARQYSIRSHV